MSYLSLVFIFLPIQMCLNDPMRAISAAPHRRNSVRAAGRRQACIICHRYDIMRQRCYFS